MATLGGLKSETTLLRTVATLRHSLSRPAIAVLFSTTLLAADLPSIPAVHREAAMQAKQSFEAGKYHEAEAAYLRILAAAPNNLYVLSNLGVIRFRVGKLKLAEEALRRAVAVAPADAFSHCTLGIVYYSQGKLDDAVASLSRALKLEPKNAAAHRYLALVAEKKGWPAVAAKELEKAIQLDPTQDPALHLPFGDFLTPLEKSRLLIPHSVTQ